MDGRVCLVDGCDIADIYSRGYCRYHYREQWRANNTTPIKHGTLHGYTNRRCRCEACTAAQAKYNAARRARKAGK